MAKSSANIVRKAPPRAKRLGRLLEVSAALFASKGYEATSMQDVAEAMGVLKGSLYHYVDSKETILFEVIQQTYRKGLDNIVLPSEDLAPDGALRLMISRHIAFLLDNLDASRVLLHEAGALAGAYRQTVDRQLLDYTGTFRRTIEDGQKAGVFNPDLDIDYACNFVLGACNWVYRWCDDATDASKDRLQRQFSDMILAGLTGPSPGTRA